MMYIVHIIGLDRNTMSVNQLYIYIYMVWSYGVWNMDVYLLYYI